jgi:hypothetical protein
LVGEFGKPTQCGTGDVSVTPTQQEKDRPLVFWEDDEEAMPEIAVALSAIASYLLADSSVCHDAEQRTHHGVHLPAVRAARICTPQQK